MLSRRLFREGRKCTRSASTLPKEIDIVIGGGGVVGCSVAYHCAVKNMPSIVLEQNTWGSGTTWHAAGLVGQLRGSSSETMLSGVYGCELYEALEEELDMSAGFKRTGSLTLATTEDRLHQLKRVLDRARCWGVPAEYVTPAQIKDIEPLLNVDDVIGGLHIPQDGAISASDVCNCFIKGGKKYGAKFADRVRILNVIPKKEGVEGYTVVTDKGDIECKHFVNSAGQWARELGALSGVNVPLFSCEHYYIVSKPFGVPRMSPVVRDLDSLLYMREWSGGLLAGVFEREAKAAFTDGKVPHDFEFSLLEQDWEHFMPYMEDIIRRYPCLAEAECQLINGPESFTPDMGYLMGAANELTNYYIAAGMNSSGIASSGGMGRAISSWIEKNYCDSDLTNIDARRIQPHEGNWDFCRVRSEEALGRHYVVHYPGMEWVTARDLRKSHLHDRLVSRGAVMGQKSGWERALWFRTDGGKQENEYDWYKPNWDPFVAKEVEACRNKAAIFDISSFGKIMIVGKDAEKELQRICANDISGPVGNITYTQVLNPDGTIEADITIQKIAENEFYWVTGAATAGRDLAWVKKIVREGPRGEDSNCNAVDVTAAYGVLSVMGPNSRALLEKVSRESTSFSNEEFPFGTWQTIDLGYARVRAARITYVGELGWELHTPAENMQHVYDTLMNAADENPELGVVNGGYLAVESMRLEKGYRGFGHDISPGEDPLMAGLGFAVKWDKDFVGKEALLKKKEDGFKSRMVQFKIPSRPDLRIWGGEPIKLNGQYVGYLNSGQHSWNFGCGIGMGYVKKKSDKKLTKKFFETNANNFTIQVADEDVPAEISLAPLLDPKGLRVKGQY